jgi:hypothetical protein
MFRIGLVRTMAQKNGINQLDILATKRYRDALPLKALRLYKQSLPTCYFLQYLKQKVSHYLTYVIRKSRKITSPLYKYHERSSDIPDGFIHFGGRVIFSYIGPTC